MSLSIRSEVDLVCDKCQAINQFLPHGWCYKADADGRMRKVGKRVICDRRRGGHGCGATAKILSQDETHQLHVTTACLSTFIQALACTSTILDAYYQATQTKGSRNAWRWWDKLKKLEGRLRQALFVQFELKNTNPSPTKPLPRHQVLRKTLSRWLSANTESCLCANWQMEEQASLL